MQPMRTVGRCVNRWLPKRSSHLASATANDPPSTLARRRRVVGITAACGTGLLATSLSSRPGSKRFHRYSWATAATWVVGGLLSGSQHRGWVEHGNGQLGRPVLAPIVTGVAAFGAFCAAGLAARRVPLLRHAIERVLLYAEHGHTRQILLLVWANALGEEVFFRGAVYPACPAPHQVAVSTAMNAVATFGTRNPALVPASLAMGTLFGLQRRASGGIQASALTHLTWSTLMVLVFPRVFRERTDRDTPHNSTAVPAHTRARVTT